MARRAQTAAGKLFKGRKACAGCLLCLGRRAGNGSPIAHTTTAWPGRATLRLRVS